MSEPNPFTGFRDIFRHRHPPSLEEVEPDDGDDEGGPPLEQPSRGWNDDFIILDRGTMFVRKYEVVGMRWEKYHNEDLDNGFAWRLKVFFGDCPALYLWGEEARDMLLSFELPGDPPDGPEQAR